MMRKNMLKKNLNSLYSTLNRKLKTLYFWLFNLFEQKCAGMVVPCTFNLRFYRVEFRLVDV